MRVGGRLARSLPLRPLIRRHFCRYTNIVYYHAVWGPDDAQLGAFGGMTIDDFERDMRIIGEHFTPASLSEVLAGSTARHRADRPLISVTFDDGCDLRRSGAMDVLDHYQIPATTFVVLACLESPHLMWQHALAAIRARCGDEKYLREFNLLLARISAGTVVTSVAEQTSATIWWPMEHKDEYVAELWRACGMPPVGQFLEEQRPYSTWEDLEQWQSAGHAVGLHTNTHPFCSRLTTWEMVVEEIIAPAKRLRARLQLNAVPFAYPFGKRVQSFSEETIASAADLSCMLGAGDLSPQGAKPTDLSRTSGEESLDISLFARPIARHWWPLAGTRNRMKHDTADDLI